MRTLFLRSNCSWHHTTELKTWRHVTWQHWTTRTPISQVKRGDFRLVTLFTNTVVSHKWGKDWQVLLTSGAYPWSFQVIVCFNKSKYTVCDVIFSQINHWNHFFMTLLLSFDFCLKVYCHLLLCVFCLSSVWRFIATCSYMCSVWPLLEGLLPPAPICVLFELC